MLTKNNKITTTNNKQHLPGLRSAWRPASAAANNAKANNNNNQHLAGLRSRDHLGAQHQPRQKNNKTKTTTNNQHLAALRSDDHLGTQHAHQTPPLNREGLRHDDDAVVAALSADHRHRDARVSRGGLDHRVARLERAALLGILDDGDGEAVLDARERVEVLALSVHLALRWVELGRDLDHRSCEAGRRVVEAAGGCRSGPGRGSAARANAQNGRRAARRRRGGGAHCCQLSS